MSDRCHPHQARACRECADKPQVAVIDPANTADVERLTKLIDNTGTLAEALTRYAAGEGLTPPKPAEPTGLGAVVRLPSGTHLVRMSDRPYPWNSLDGWFTWAELPNDLTVLSEGVQPEPTPDPWASYYDRDLTVADLLVLPVGSVVVDRDGDEAMKRADGWWCYAPGSCRSRDIVHYRSPIRLVSVGGEGK